MNDPENQFEDIAQLLKLKRHEQPPPGYLDRLPGRIIARIEAEQISHHAKPVWLSWLTGRPGGITLGIGAAAAFLLTATLWLPEDAGNPDLTAGPAGAGRLLDPVAHGIIESSLGMPVVPVYAANATNPLAPVLAPDTAPPGLFNVSGVLSLSNASTAERVNFNLPR